MDIKEIPEAELLELLDVIRKILNDTLEPYSIYLRHPDFMYQFERGLLFSFGKSWRYSMFMPVNYAFLTMDNEKLLISLNLWTPFYEKGKDFSDYHYTDKTIEKKFERLIKIADTGLPQMGCNLNEALPSELYLSNGRFTLIQRPIRLKFGSPFPTGEIDDYHAIMPSSDTVALIIDIPYDVVDEEAYAPSGKRAEEAKCHFEAEREKLQIIHDK